MPAHSTAPVVLVIDDELEFLKSISSFFADLGYRSIEARNGREGLEAVRAHQPDLVFTDLRMPEMDGLSFIRLARETNPELQIVVISGTGDIAEAIQAVKLGAWDYITKPVYELSELELVAKRALETRELRSEVAAFRERFLGETLANKDAFASIITSDKQMFRIFQYMEAVAPNSQPVLISGKTGTGKELIAQTLHEVSGRKGSFVAINLGGLDDQVFSDTLFGHLRGSFTGADRPREGMVAKAAGGSLFLDEIGELSERSQVRLLRLLQEQEYYPLGSDLPRKCQARIIAATNRDLTELVKAGEFRQDLYYRLCTHQVRIPPLAARNSDIRLLLEYFLSEAAASMGKKTPAVPPELYGYLATYDFPGNIRELKAMAYDAVARHKQGPLALESFLSAMGARPAAQHHSALDETIGRIGDFGPRIPTLKEAQNALIAKALELGGGNQGIAARHLGITRHALNKILIRQKQRQGEGSL